MPNQIDTIIDGKETYAYAYITKSAGYAHMIVDIRQKQQQYSWRDPGMVKITCQVGSNGDYDRQCIEPYAVKHGFNSRGECISLEELVAATKIMKKIDKYLDACMVGRGFGTADYAEYCQRVIVGSGAKWLIAEPFEGMVNGSRMAEKDLIKVGPDSLIRLALMKDTLVNIFARKAA